MAYLLDTNVCIALINGASDRVRKKFSNVASAGQAAWVSSVSLYELWYGVAKSARVTANALRVTTFLAGPARVLEFAEQDAQMAGRIRSDLERMGRPIGAYDLLIAGQAISRGFKLVTANAREFARVKDLDWEDWER